MSTIGTPAGVHFDNIFSVGSLDPEAFDFPKLELVVIDEESPYPLAVLMPVKSSPARGRFFLNRLQDTPEARAQLEGFARAFNADPTVSWLRLLDITLPQARASLEALVAADEEEGDDVLLELDGERLAHVAKLEQAFLC